MSYNHHHPLSSTPEVPPELLTFAHLSLQPSAAEARLSPTINIHPPTPPLVATSPYSSQLPPEDDMDVDKTDTPIAAACTVANHVIDDPDATIRPPKPKFRKPCSLTISIPPAEPAETVPYNAEHSAASPQQNPAAQLPVGPALYASAAEQLEHVRAQLAGVRRHLEAAFKQ